MTIKTDKRLNILLTKQQYSVLHFAAKTYERSMGQVIREMIDELEIKLREVGEETP